MKIAALRFAARHPGVVLLVAALLLLELGVVTTRWIASRWAQCAGASATSSASVPSPQEPRTVLNRVWFDRYPRKATDEIKLMLFLAGGIGVHQAGSAYRSANDVFDFERQGDLLSLTFLHDRKAASTRFVVTSCDEAPPFNLCLDMPNSPRGPRRYYGFGHDEDMEVHIPWSAKLKQAARSQAEVR
jgi:hypothetical protein